ncbi:MAG TPA: hypothetical protein VNR70_13510 [Steroidobacteraceae bacterium]|nr:hypothetical protein [Steroidobacteraceae bacterium]
MTAQDKIELHSRIVDDTTGACVGAATGAVIAAILGAVLSIASIMPLGPMVGALAGVATKEFLRRQRMKMRR